jgi:hypothetical protein
MNWRSRGDILQVVIAVLAMAILGGILYVKVIAAHSPVDTSFSSHVHSLLVEPDGTLVLGDHNSVWTWSPPTRAWKRYGRPFDREMAFCLAHLPGGILLACSGQPSTQAVSRPLGLWRSGDNGRTWQQAGIPDTDVIGVAADPLTHTVIAAAAADGATGGLGHGGIYQSLDGGLTWKRVQRSIGADEVQSLAIAGKPARAFVVTPDAFWFGKGRAWRAGTGAAGQVTLTLATGPNTAEPLYAGTVGGLWMSVDFSRTWRAVARNGSYSKLAPTAHSGNLYAVLHNSVVHLVDGKTIQGQGLPAGNPGALAADPGNPNRAYVAYSFPLRVYRTTDGGRNWSQIL